MSDETPRSGARAVAEVTSHVAQHAILSVVRMEMGEFRTKKLTQEEIDNTPNFQSRVTAIDGSAPGVAVALVEYRCRIAHNLGPSTEKDGKEEDDGPQFTFVGFDVRASYRLVYSVDTEAEISEADLKMFAEINGVFNSWSYWREFIQSSTGRLMPTEHLVSLLPFRVAAHIAGYGDSPLDFEPHEEEDELGETDQTDTG